MNFLMNTIQIDLNAFMLDLYARMSFLIEDNRHGKSPLSSTEKQGTWFITVSKAGFVNED